MYLSRIQAGTFKKSPPLPLLLQGPRILPIHKQKKLLLFRKVSHSAEEYVPPCSVSFNTSYRINDNVHETSPRAVSTRSGEVLATLSSKFPESFRRVTFTAFYTIR